MLRSVELRLDVLERELAAPVMLTRGLISEFQIKIPWTSLGTNPIQVNINTIEIALSPRTEFNADLNSNSSNNEGIIIIISFFKKHEHTVFFFSL